MDKLTQSLIAAMAEMPVIDAHEHLPTEEAVVAAPADVFTRIFCHYSLGMAEAAGLPNARPRMRHTAVPLAERWRLFRPYLDAVRHTGYAQAGLITARDLYGVEDVNDDTYELLSERLVEKNKPGLYDWVLKETCRIEHILNQGLTASAWAEPRGGYAVSVDRSFLALASLSAGKMRKLHDTWAEKHGGPFADADEWIAFWLDDLVESGAVGLKFGANLPVECIEADAANALYRKLTAGELSDEESGQLGAYLMHRAIAGAGPRGLPCAFHCGLQAGAWADFRATHPLRLIPLFRAYRETTFDLYHGGIPWVSEIVVAANQFPNVCLNLCWCHQISPWMTGRMMNECLDLVPATKVIGFGGDNVMGPEKTYGVLVMARENMARALAARIRRGQIGESAALDVARLWLYDNPKRIYRL